MPVYKDKEKGTWFVTCRYKDWSGNTRQKKKRGFQTKREAREWEISFKTKREGGFNLTLSEFFQLYQEDIKPRVKYNTWLTKEYVFRSKILPYLGNKCLSDISARDIILWQNTLTSQGTNRGERYSDSYLRTIHQDLSAVFNHAIRYYDFPANPARKAGTMGGDNKKEMLFWTLEEYSKFAQVVRDNPHYYHAFQLLYWCGIREGELLALSKGDFDFDGGSLRINKSYQRLRGKDYITGPKTQKSNRVITMPEELRRELKEYLEVRRDLGERDRIFKMNKTGLYREMTRCSKIAGVKRIRIHDLRHSHVSLLIEMGFTPLAIGERVGHESERVTYRYAHLFPNKQQEMAEQLNRIMLPNRCQ